MIGFIINILGTLIYLDIINNNFNKLTDIRVFYF